MTTEKNKNLEVVSSKEQVKSKKDQMLEKIKLDMIESLKIDKKLIKRNTFAKDIEKARGNDIFPKEVEFLGKIIKIEEKKGPYKDLVAKYKEIQAGTLSFDGMSKEDMIKEVDKELAEQITLNKNKMIEFSSTEIEKTVLEEEAKKSFERLEKNKTYKEKIELIKKTNGDETLFIIKRTKKQLEEIARIEKAYEEVHKTTEEAPSEEEDKKIEEPIIEKKEIKPEEKEGTLKKNKESAEVLNTSLFVNRDNLAEAIKGAREGKDVPSGKIEIQKGVFVNIEKQIKYNEFAIKYLEAKGNNLILKELDTQFAEIVILNNPEGSSIKNRYCIQINNNEEGKKTKSEAELEQESFRCRDSLIKQGYNVEYVQYQEEKNNKEEIKKKMNEMKSLLEEMSDIQRKIDELQSELNSKSLYYTETERVAKQEELKRREKRLEKLQRTKDLLQKDIDNLKTKGEKYHIVKIIEDDEPIPPVIEEQELLEATISDTTKITRAIAEREAGEKLRKMYKKTARYKPRSWPTQLTLFLGRGFIKDHYTRKYMKMKGGMQREKNLTTGVDRHEMEFENKFNDNITSIGTIDENTYPETYKEIIIIGERLEQGTITPVDFQKDFKDIIEDPTLDTSASPKLTDLIKQNDIQQMSSNITEKITAFADHKKLVAGIIGYMGEPDDNVFDNKCRTDIAKYFKDHKLQPKFLKDMGLKLDDPNTIKDLRNNISHRATLKQIAAKTMKLKIQILTKGEEAYDVKQELKGFRGAMTKTGDRLDKPISDTSKFGKRLENHPFAKNAFGSLRGITKLGVMITPALLLAPLGPLAVASGAGGMTFIKTLFKKYSHYNKEHMGYQRNQANNLLTNRAERTRLLNEMNKMTSSEKFFRYYFGIGKKSKEVRQFRDYLKTTHDQLENSKDMIQKMEALLHKGKLTNTEPDQLERLIAQGLARIDHHKTTGQNFLGSENETTSEEEYQTIHRLVLTGAMRLDKDLTTDIRPTRAYKRELNTLNHGNGGNEINEIGYEKARKRFKNRQTEKALIGAVRAGGIAFGLSYLASSLASSKGSTETVSDSTGVKENFTLGGHESGGNGVYEQSKTFFQNPDAVNQKIIFKYGGGTDATPVIEGHLTSSEYTQKALEVQKEISQMNNLSFRTRLNLMNEIQKKPWEQVRAEKGFTNDYLQGMRCIEGIEQTAKALNDSGVNAGKITIVPGYEGSVHDIVGKTYNNAGERVVQGTLDYSKETIIEPVKRAIPVVSRKNTFQEPMKGEQQTGNENQETPTKEDNPGRKTRTPAPKTNKIKNKPIK